MTIHSAAREAITSEQVKKLLNYDPSTGIFTWRKQPKPLNRCKQEGVVAGGLKPDGYITITIGGRGYRAHRLAILYMEGYFPENGVDHINRVRDDNRYSNLREATHQCQMRNKTMMRNNASGINGVYWSKPKSRWRVEIGNGVRAKFVALCRTLEEAAYLRYAAEQCLGFQDCDITSSAKKYIDITKR